MFPSAARPSWGMQGSFPPLTGPWEAVQEGPNTLLTHLETLHLFVSAEQRNPHYRQVTGELVFFFASQTQFIGSRFGFMVTQCRTAQVSPSHIYQAVPQAAAVSKQEKRTQKRLSRVLFSRCHVLLWNSEGLKAPPFDWDCNWCIFPNSIWVSPLIRNK